MVKPLTIGPIVVATTGDSVRLWGWGGLELLEFGLRQIYGAARLRAAGSGSGPSNR